MKKQYIVRNFTMDDFEKEVEICRKQLEKLGYRGIRNKKYELTLSNKMSKTCGLCTYIKGWSEFRITLNTNFVNTAEEESMIREVIMHELCHTIKGCDNHTGKWLEVVTRVNQAYGYSIKRTAPLSKNYDDYCKEKGYGVDKYKITCKDCGGVCYYTNRTKIVKFLLLNDVSAYMCGYCGSLTLGIEVLNNE